MKITNDYINSITQTSFWGMETVDIISGTVLRNLFALGMKKIILPKTLEKWTHKPSYLWPNRKIYVSVKPENFYNASKEYIRNILKTMGADLARVLFI